jgi:hypothetical protein
MPIPTPKSGHAYPVISLSLESVEHALREDGRAFSFNEQGLDALAAVNARKRTPVEVSIWAREEHGMSRSNQPALLIYLYVVAPRGGSAIARRFLKELNLRWLDECQLIGNHPLVGAERPLWELDATGARSST